MRLPFSFRIALSFGLALFVSACGFHLRGASELPYRSFYVAISPDMERGAELRRQIRAHQPDILVEDIQKADGVFRELGYHTDRIIAALNVEGRAREYQLRLTYTFRVEDNKGAPLTPVNEIVLTREITYDDNQLLAKDQEENFLWEDMSKDLAAQILRRLAYMQPQTIAPGVEADD
ncbi:MAG: LPS assembly lipoprotein LptE [Zoogloeaceae bacterium]|jgi:LPS-assembly lipoprotein|nr:LPS assembly lipoprotein LptE [Zoogloeaceae bacterium]